jgi:subtilisin family serine protease
MDIRFSTHEAPRRRSRTIRRSRPLGEERLESRRLMAADADPSIAVSRFSWNGETVAARADAWIVRADAQPGALGLRTGWHTASLGEGLLSLVAPGASPTDVLGWARSTAGVRYVEPDRVVNAAATVANDPSISRLWGLENVGQTGGVADADIDAPEAWDVTTGSRAVVVAVVDTGVDYNHPDLAANMWRNPGETAGDGIDNDRNGYIDDVHGWNFVTNTANVFDDNSHGTHVAGTIGAVGNNGSGIAGVNWQVSIMALKFLNASGSGTTSAAIAALNYATMMRRTSGVNIVATNNSWGGGGYSTALRDAITAGGNAGILCIAAAGNSGSDNDSVGSYPANSVGTAGISVAATDSSNRLASFSNYGATTVHVAAPGVGIYSTVPNNGYASYSGTSMATPHVAGLVALMAAANPQATVAQIRSTILSTATTVSGLAGKCSTGGVINAAAAVRAIGGPTAPEPPSVEPPPASGPLEPNDSLATATAVTLSANAAAFSGTIGDGAYAAADVDLFAVQLAAGTALTARIDAARLSTPSSLDSYLRLFTASGTPLAGNDDAAGSLDSLLTYTVTTSGTYYVGVSSYGNSSYSATTAGSGTTGHTTGAYTLTLSVAATAPVADIIDVTPDPRTTSVGAVIVRFDRAVTGFDVADLSLLRNGSVVPLSGAAVTTTDNVTWTVAGLEPLTATEGSYTLALNAAGSGIVSVDGGMALAAPAFDSWTVQAARLVDAGDTMAAAAAIGITSGELRLSGLIGDGSFGSRDVDLYRVTLAAGQSLVVDIDAKSLAGSSTLDSYVRIFNAAGRQLAANDDANGSLDSYLSVRAAAAGTYYVGISGYGNASYNPTRARSGSWGSTGGYQVRLAFSPLATATGAARIAGARDATAPGTSPTGLAAAFAMYGANWNAALPATAAGQRVLRRP